MMLNTALAVRFAKFVSTSFVGTLADMLVLWLLSDLVFTRGYWGEYVISPAISFQCAVAVNYTLSYFYIWKDRTLGRPDASLKRFLKLYLAYNLSGTAVFLLRLGILLLIERFTGWDVLLCNIVAMCFSGILNFAIDGKLIFRKKRTFGKSDH